MSKKFYTGKVEIITNEMINSFNVFWASGKPGVSDTFFKSLAERQKKMEGLIAKAKPISAAAIIRLYEESDKSNFLSASAESLLTKLGNLSQEAS